MSGGNKRCSIGYDPDTLMSSLREALHSGRVLLMDGAMGTELMRAGWPVERGFECLNTEHPDAVQAIHRAYAAAGAEVVLTNTFQAWRAALDAGENLGALLARSVNLAREAAPNAFVLAAVGPTAAIVPEQVHDLFQGCRRADGVLLETWSDAGLAAHIAELQRQSPSPMPLLVSFTFRRGSDGGLRTFTDMTPEECARAMSAAGVAALGVNCGLEIGRDELLEILRRYRTVTGLPLLARPNAGTPRTIGGMVEHSRTPADLAAWLPALFGAGVTMIGGCCGTTPRHVAAFRKNVDEWNNGTR
jgi:5-methyltetrahydrofolate--homocysteine methyltransferase